MADPIEKVEDVMVLGIFVLFVFGVYVIGDKVGLWKLIFGVGNGGANNNNPNGPQNYDHTYTYGTPPGVSEWSLQNFFGLFDDFFHVAGEGWKQLTGQEPWGGGDRSTTEQNQPDPEVQNFVNQFKTGVYDQGFAS